ncbi:PREDICTED: chemokine-like receptor 1 [Nanorana parkeri]|uniref:chemokine-like receptor 1 n=1 Tax=Nanorana parkeri TaxID=125878 RepID=UPI00085410CB|nr:PREDICTED: chemokine-like receptor 1 [Nanorana parkeri]
MAYPITNVTQQAGSIIDHITNSVNVIASPENRKNPAQQILQNISIVVCAVTFFLGTMGNGLVIFFTTFRMKKTVSVVCFLNLAIADFIFTFLLIFRIVRLTLAFHWPFGRVMCKVDVTVFYINLFASLFLITVISIDRLVIVKFPVWCQNHRNPRLASIVASIVWILLLLFSLPYTIFKDTVNVKNAVHCKYNYDIDASMATSITRFIIGFVLPLTVIVSCYTVILLHIRRNYTTMSNKPLKMIAAVIIVFFVCWFPYHIFSLLQLSIKYGGKNYFKDVVLIGKHFSTSIAIMNSCVNPILYVFMGHDFKEKFWSSIQPMFENAFMEEPIQTQE